MKTLVEMIDIAFICESIKYNIEFPEDFRNPNDIKKTFNDVDLIEYDIKSIKIKRSDEYRGIYHIKTKKDVYDIDIKFMSSEVVSTVNKKSIDFHAFGIDKKISGNMGRKPAQVIEYLLGEIKKRL